MKNMTDCVMIEGYGAVQRREYVDAAPVSDERVGKYIRTRTGRKFYPHDPRPEDMFIEDIAWPLSRINRYTGHTKISYSVAQHCVLGARWLIANDRPWKPTRGEAYNFLMHDATEAFGIGDVSSPAKARLVDFMAMEERIAAAVQTRFQCAHTPTVEVVDHRILADEMADLMGDHGDVDYEPLDIRINEWTAEQACLEFMMMFYALAPVDVITSTSHYRHMGTAP
jgi:uncharacterized protein